MMDVDLTNAKHAASQAKRLASLREKQDYQRQQQALISEALKSADKLPKTKRIVFDSEESDNDVDDVPKRSKKMNLFDDDDDDECPDLSETNPEQLVSSRFKGRGSEKLTKLQNSYGNDDRFKLDHTFLDDEEQVDEGEFNMEQEKERQMRMLSMVVGRDVIAKHSTTSKDQVKAKPFQRFDPFNPEHVAWVKNQQKSKDDDSEYEVPVAKKSKKEEQERPVFDDRMYYSIDESFANELKAKLASTKEEKVFFLSKKEAAVEEADMKDQEASVSKPMLIKRLANKVPNFFLTEKDTQIRSKLQKYEAKRNTEIEKKKWTVFKEAFWKNAKNLRRQKMRELAPGNPKNNKFRAQKA